MTDWKDLIKYWVGLSDYDMKTADFMFETKRYPYCLFMCHLAIEKILKAIMVGKTKEQAPYTHNLIDLGRKTGIDFSENDKDLLADLVEFNIEARYPEWKRNFYKKATKQYTENYLKETKIFQKWLKKSLKK